MDDVNSPDKFKATFYIINDTISVLLADKTRLLSCSPSYFLISISDVFGLKWLIRIQRTLNNHFRPKPLISKITKVKKHKFIHIDYLKLPDQFKATFTLLTTLFLL